MKKFIVIACMLAAGSVFSAPYNFMKEVLEACPTKEAVSNQVTARLTVGISTNYVIPALTNTVPSCSAVSNNVATLAASIASITAKLPVVDTNSVTVLTNYVPVAKGSILVGKLHADTNAVWVAVGTTTNDWLLVGQTPEP